MTTKRQNSEGGINIGGNVTVKGDMVGRDKVTKTYNISVQTQNKIVKSFQPIRKKAEQEIGDEEERGLVLDRLSKIEEELKKGDQADSNKVEKWLKFLSGMSDDIYQVVVSTIANPALGISKAIQLIAQRAKSNT